ncbi:glutathione S-transferase P 1-like [Lithobates pipiens]
MLEAHIKVIPKEDKDASLVTNYRPISLINVDVKIYVKILANRLLPLLPSLISLDQLLFIKSVCLPIGRGESIRLILADNGAKWTEDVIQFADWFGGKCPLKKEAVFGQLPQFSDGDFVLYQSNTILRYLGRKFGEYIAYHCYETGMEKYEKDLPNQLSAFERILSKNSNGTKFLVGDKISYADYNLLDVLHCHLNIFPKPAFHHKVISVNI